MRTRRPRTDELVASIDKLDSLISERGFSAPAEDASFLENPACDEETSDLSDCKHQGSCEADDATMNPPREHHENDGHATVGEESQPQKAAEITMENEKTPQSFRCPPGPAADSGEVMYQDAG